MAATTLESSTWPQVRISATPGSCYLRLHSGPAPDCSRLPLQSTTWKAIRGLHSPAEERNPAFRAGQDAWARRRTGEWNQQQVQQHLMVDPETGALRIRPPSWHTGSAIEETD
jgi:hypothetical protein